LVDDDQALLSALQFTLELEGFAVIPHADALSVAPADLPAHDCCLVIDYVMPHRNGLELLVRLREARIDLPAIIITSHARAAIRAQAKALGAAIVEKPLLRDELVNAIRRAMAAG
jgi:two-component system, LuxR family, response regulator FixJ